MNNMTWLDLYKFLNDQANNPKNFGSLNWTDPVMIHDAETGDEFNCDTYQITDSRGTDRLVLTINTEKIFDE